MEHLRRKKTFFAYCFTNHLLSLPLSLSQLLLSSKTRKPFKDRAYLKEWTLILYGTYDDPNRHLDPIQATTTPQSTTTTSNTQTATFTLEPHHSKHLSTIPPPTLQGSQVSSGTQSSSPSLNKPAASNPPPPINQSPTESTSSPPSRPWLHSYSSPAPPPPPPLPPVATSMPPKVASSSPHPPTISSTSSYVTTFKTIVSTPSSSSATSSSSPPPPNLSSQQPAQGNTGSSRVQIDQSGQIIKADFEVVSPPSLPVTSTTTTATTTTSTNFNTLQQSDARFRLPPQGEHGYHSFNTTSFDVNSIARLKPPVNQIDSNKIDVPTNRLTVSQQDPQGNTHNNNTHNNNNSGQQQNQPELIDGQNQIDSKLTKDYRSSGDQSSNYFSPTKTTTINDLNVDSANKVQTKLVDQQNSAANLGAQPSLTLILVALIGVVGVSSNYLRPLSDYLIFSNSIHVIVRPRLSGAIFWW